MNRYVPAMRPSGGMSPLPIEDGYVLIDAIPAWSAIYIDGRPRAAVWERDPFKAGTVYSARVTVSAAPHDVVVVPPGGKARTARVKVGGANYPALLRFDQMTTATSGAVGDRPVADPATVPTITENVHAVPSPVVRRYQRILLGIGFPVGTKGADGIPGPETMRAVETFARTWNSDPTLRNGAPNLTVDRRLTPEKQIALQRFEATASDQLTSRTTTSVISVTPPAPIPWGTVALVGTAGAALLGLVVYAVNESSKKKAARS